MVRWRGVELPSALGGIRDVVEPEATAGRLAGGEYGGTASGYGATEWYEGASETGEEKAAIQPRVSYSSLERGLH